MSSLARRSARTAFLFRVLYSTESLTDDLRGVAYPPRIQRALKDFLSREFRDLIQVNEQRDRGITGNMEVFILNTGKLIHSKRRGQGLADTANARQSIVEQIREALEAV